jgi:LacI family transcriptional regulator
MDGAIEELLHMHPKVDAIFFATNSISITGIRSLLKKGLLVQKDIQVMCFDESEAILLFPFRVPYVKQPVEEMAKNALELLIAQIEKKEEAARQIVLDAELIV